MKKYLLIISLAAMALTACNENPATKVGNPLGSVLAPTDGAKAMMEKGLTTDPVLEGSSAGELFADEIFSLKFDVASGSVSVSSTEMTDPVTISGLDVQNDGSFTAKDEASDITIEGALDDNSDKYPLVITVTKTDGKGTGRFFASNDVNSFNNFNKPVDEGCFDADASLKLDGSTYVASFVETPDMKVFDHCKDTETLVEMSCGTNGDYVANIVECDCIKGKCMNVDDDGKPLTKSDEDVCGAYNWACLQKKMMEAAYEGMKTFHDSQEKIQSNIYNLPKVQNQKLLDAFNAMKGLLK